MVLKKIYTNTCTKRKLSWWPPGERGWLSLTRELKPRADAAPHRASHRDSGQQAFRHVGDNDTDEEDDGLEPGVLEDQGKDEEGHPQEHSHARDEVDEMLDFRSYGSLAPFQPRGEGGDSSHHRAVPGVHDDAPGSS